MSKRDFLVFCLVTFVLSGSPDAHGGNLVRNGQFTDYTTGSQGIGWVLLSAGTSYNRYTTLDTWASPADGTLEALIDGTTGQSWDPYYNRYENRSFLLTNNKPAGNYLMIDGDHELGYAPDLSQTLTGLTPGNEYSVNFWYGGSGSDFRTYERFVVSLGDQTQYTTDGTYNLDGGTYLDTPGAVFSGWINTTMKFTADQTSELLNFTGQGGPRGLPPWLFLADISVTDTTTSPVPEPSSAVLAGVGMIAVAVVRYRRNSKSAKV
jgi:hypothetical protein